MAGSKEARVVTQATDDALSKMLLGTARRELRTDAHR